MNGDDAHLMNFYLRTFWQCVAFCKQIAHFFHAGALQHGIVNGFEMAHHVTLEMVDLIGLNEITSTNLYHMAIEMFDDRIAA
ncbi:hypothetical protein D3C72_2411620 [compost metagenome]